ncbi:MAG: hypothetical protein ACYTXA_17320 [Nostoc sp.]
MWCKCNPYPTGSSNHCFISLEQIDEALDNLPTPIRGQQYYLLFVDVESLDISELLHPRLKLLGYDLSDLTLTSSLLNCGRWIAVLAPIAQRVNQYGLLNLEDALKAQALLPEAWNYSHHGDVTIWALIEVD